MRVENFQLVLSSGPVKFARSPNFDPQLRETLFVIMHYTGGPSLNSSVSWMTNPTSKVSAHLVIGRNGEVVQLVPFNCMAWHAGASQWKEYSSLNNYSIGIELDNAGMMKRNGNQWISSFGGVYPNADVLAAPHKNAPGTIYGWHKYTDIQLKTAAEVVAALVRAYGIREILGHDDIAPSRKVDPGPAFPLEQFRAAVAALVKSDSSGGEEPGPTPPDDGETEPIPPERTATRYKVENLATGASTEYTLSTAFKPVVLLPVPYVSQLGAGAEAHRNDCGAASAIMLLRAYQPDLRLTPDEFYTKFSIPGADPYLSVPQLRNALGSLGVLTDFKATLSVQDLFAFLAAGKPVIVLLRYKVFEDAGLTEKHFEGPHFAVVVGMDAKNVYIHDPLYTHPADGEAHAYPLDLFWKAWKEVATDPKLRNPERSAIIPTAGIGFKLARQVKVNVAALKVYQGAALNTPVVKTLNRGTVIEVTREMSGWGEIAGVGWVYLAYTVAA